MKLVDIIYVRYLRYRYFRNYKKKGVVFDKTSHRTVFLKEIITLPEN